MSEEISSTKSPQKFTHLQNAKWQKACAYVYLLICIFDFIIVPTWFGITRVVKDVEYEVFSKLDPSVQIRMIDARTLQHEPYTLKGAGMFHLAFGALLTGSAVSAFRKETQK